MHGSKTQVKRAKKWVAERRNSFVSNLLADIAASENGNPIDASLNLLAISEDEARSRWQGETEKRSACIMRQRCLQ